MAVDNMNGAMLCGKIISVDHVEKFVPPKEGRKRLGFSDDKIEEREEKVY